jgi:quinol monooxygenase YgiN
MSTGPGILAHDVYFTLRDASPAARRRLVDACIAHLSGHPGIVSFSAGERAAEMRREVNDAAFDVSLHVGFVDRAAHDAYQQHPRHRRFIEEMDANWAAVRVFDSWVTTVS